MDAHANLAYSTVLTAPSPASSGTSLVVAAGTGTRFPAVPFNATIWPISAIPTPANAEIVRVTNISSDTLTITRTQESTSARTILVGDQIAATITVKTLTDIETAIPSTAGLLSNIKVSAGAASALLSALTFSNGSGVSFGLNASTITASVAAQSTQSAIKAFGASNTGNTAGNTGLSTGIDWVLAGSNNITISQSTAGGGPNTLWVSGPAAQTNQSAIKGLGASNTGNTAGNTGLSTGIDWVLAGSNNITISQSTVGGGPNTLWVSGANAGGAQTGISGFGVSDTTYTSGTVILSAQANITIGSSVNGASQYARFSVAAQTNQSAIKAFGATNTGNTAGNTGVSTGIDWVLAGSNGVTISESTAGGGPNTLWVSGTTYPAQSNQSAIKGLGVSNTGNTAGNTGLSTGIDWVIAGSNGITASQSTAAGGPDTIWISGVTTVAQSNQTVGFYGVGNTESSSSGTLDARTMSFRGLGAATVGYSNGTILIDAPNAAAGNVTFSAGANSSGLGSVIFANSNNITFGLTTGSQITASFGGGGGAGIGITNSGNTAGTSGTVTAGNYYLIGSGAITLSQSSSGSNGTLTITVPQTSSLVGSLGISLSTNGSTVTISNNYIGHYEPFPMLSGVSGTWAPTSSSWYFQPFELVNPVSGGRFNILVNHGSTASIMPLSSANFQTGTTGTGSTNFTYARKMALYSLGAGTNSTRLETVWTNQWSLSIDHLNKVASGGATTLTVSHGATMTYLSAIDSLGNITTTTYGNSATTSSGTSSLGTTAITSVLTSMRNILSSQLMIPIPFTGTLNPGLYYLAQMWITGSTTNATGNLTSTFQQVSVVNQACAWSNSSAHVSWRQWGQTATSSSFQPFLGVGIYSAGSASPPDTVAFSDLRTYASQNVNYVNYMNSTI